MSLWQLFTFRHLTLIWQSWARNRPGTWASARPDPLSPIITGEKSSLHQTARSHFVGLYQIFLIGIKPLGIKTKGHHVVFGQSCKQWRPPQQQRLDEGFICLFSFLRRDSESSILLEDKSAYCFLKYEHIDWIKRGWNQNNDKATIQNKG